MESFTHDSPALLPGLFIYINTCDYLENCLILSCVSTVIQVTAGVNDQALQHATSDFLYVQQFDITP